MCKRDYRFESCPDYNLVLVEFQKATTEQKTIYLIGIEVPDNSERRVRKQERVSIDMDTIPDTNLSC